MLIYNSAVPATTLIRFIITIVQRWSDKLKVVQLFIDQISLKKNFFVVRFPPVVILNTCLEL